VKIDERLITRKGFGLTELLQAIQHILSFLWAGIVKVDSPVHSSSLGL
jgi:hypothetical protein